MKRRRLASAKEPVDAHTRFPDVNVGQRSCSLRLLQRCVLNVATGTSFWKDFTREKSADGFRRPAGGRFDDDARASGDSALSFPLYAEWLATTVHRLGCDASGKGGRVGQEATVHPVESYSIIFNQSRMHSKRCRLNKSQDDVPVASYSGPSRRLQCFAYPVTGNPDAGKSDVVKSCNQTQRIVSQQLKRQSVAKQLTDYIMKIH
ncbi:hypothetical protein F511_29236 [Dorcoceras hygrometricum]|uniref:Uncharacterized protein n=1 Tax=Dorcoceras hygrometricum TaxID=472368 RepID=A0A2Z7BDY2_9LAMI|nr:hypothetical protein F511_29236 [Dorcoceras hygrometricum]